MKCSTNVVEEEPVYTNLSDYFRDHPEEEAGFYDDLAQIAAEEEILDIPEDW